MPIANNGAPWCANGNCTPNTSSTCATPEGIVNGTQVVNSFRVGDQINALCQTDLNVWKYACNIAKYASLPYLMFSKEEYDMSTGVKKILQFKNIPQFHTLSESGKSVKWGEMLEAFPEAFVDGAQSGNEITVTSLDSLMKFFVNDHVRIYGCSEEDDCCAVEISANILEIDTVNLTITFDKVVNVCDGDRILRMYNLVETCGEFKNGVSLDPTNYFESFYQYFGGELCFDKNEINKCYATEGGVMTYINAKFSALYQDLFLQVGNARWYGLNIQEVSGVQKAQTMGIITGIYKHVELGKSLIHDLSNKTSDQAKVKALLAIFMEAQSCQIEGIDNTLVVAGNHLFYQALSTLNPAWNALMGCMPVCDKSMDVSFEVKVINTIFGRVEFYADFFLQYYYQKKSFAVVLPKGMSSMYMPENERVIVQGDNVTLERVVPWFKVVDLAIKNIGKVGCGTCIMVHDQFAYVHAGLASGAYRIIEGLRG